MPRPKVPAPQQELEQILQEEPIEEPIPVFVIACGGFSEAIYFEKLSEGREDVHVQLLPPLTEVQAKHGEEKPHLSSPLQTVERALKRLDVTSGDTVWVLLDVDHHFQEGHVPGTEEALEKAHEQGYKVAFSNPCFEIWLLMHTEEVLAVWPDCHSLEVHLKRKWGSYQKKRFNVERLRPFVRDAIERGKRSPNVDQIAPSNPGTQVHLLLEALEQACGSGTLF